MELKSKKQRWLALMITGIIGEIIFIAMAVRCAFGTGTAITSDRVVFFYCFSTALFFLLASNIFEVSGWKSFFGFISLGAVILSYVCVAVILFRTGAAEGIPLFLGMLLLLVSLAATIFPFLKNFFWEIGVFGMALCLPGMMVVPEYAMLYIILWAFAIFAARDVNAKSVIIVVVLACLIMPLFSKMLKQRKNWRQTMPLKLKTRDDIHREIRQKPQYSREEMRQQNNFIITVK